MNLTAGPVELGNRRQLVLLDCQSVVRPEVHETQIFLVVTFSKCSDGLEKRRLHLMVGEKRLEEDRMAVYWRAGTI